MKKFKFIVCLIVLLILFFNLSFAQKHQEINNNTAILPNQIYQNYYQIGKGGVFYITQKGTLTLGSNVKFSENTATEYGGAVVNNGTLNIQSSGYYYNNKAQTKYGGAIANAGIINIDNNTIFEKNNSKDSGGAIYNSESGDITIDSYVKFLSNIATQAGGAISNNYIIRIKDNILFSSNTAGSYGGAIMNDEGGLKIGNNNIFQYNCTTAQGKNGWGGAIYNNGNLEIKIGNEFYNNFSTYGGAIYNSEKGYITIDSHINFSNNYSTQTGGAICNKGTIINIGNNATFYNNQAIADSGGAIANFGTMIIDENTNFILNQAGTQGSGGAIHNSGSVTIKDNVTFANNTAISGGGAIANAGRINIDNNAIFEKNNSKDSGGAIHNSGSVTIKDNVTFANNTAISGGGAIANAGRINIGNNAIFEKNNSKDSGGAIYNSESGDITIGASTKFLDNTEQLNGGAIHNEGILTLLDGGKFINNKTIGKGGAIYLYDDNITPILGSRTINLIADTNDIEFTGNKQYYGTEYEESNAIYSKGRTTINLLANSNANIIFNDKITGQDSTMSMLNINSHTANGKIILNEDMSGYNGTVYLYGGEIELQAKTDANNINQNKFFSGNIYLIRGTLNIKNNAIDNIIVSDLGTGTTQNTNLQFDVNLSNNTSDNFTVEDGTTGELNLTAINILGVNGNSGQITLFNNENSPTLNILTTGVYGEREYVFINSDVAGILNYRLKGFKTFKEIVNETESAIRSYSLAKDEIVTEDLGQLGGLQLTIFGNVYDIIANSVSGIIVREGQTLNIENIKEIKNFNSENYGGFINNAGIINISDNMIFSSNTTIYDGGAIYNSGNIVIKSGTRFINNKAQTDCGGAIANIGTITIEDNAIFEKNSSAGSGGAIYNSKQGNVTIGKNVTFSNNTEQYNGGAIHNEGILTLLDGGKFINNTAKETGGAINLYNGGILNLIANTNNIEFTGNTDYLYDKTSNAIHSNGGTINLWVSKNASIIFNDKIRSGENENILNINSSTTTLTANGKIILKEDMSGYNGTVNLYGGEIELQAKMEENLHINTNKLFSGNINLQNGTLNILNGAIDNIELATLTTAENANLKFDTDLGNNISDNFTITNSATGQLNLTAINILGVNGNSGQITLFNNENSPTLNILTTGVYDGYEYNFTNGQMGKLYYEKGEKVNLKNTINKKMPVIRSYSLAENEIVYEYLGNLGGTQLTIFGNNKNIIGNNIGGIFVAKGKTLNIENVNSWSGFSRTYGAIKNEGTLNITDTNFNSNIEQDIINDGSLVLNGNSSFENGITGNGVTTIRGNIINNGTIINSLNIDLDAKLINNGTLTVNNGINNGNIGQKNNTSNMIILENFINNGTINQNRVTIENNAILRLTNNSVLITNNLIANNAIIDMANEIIQEHNFNTLTINNTLNLVVDADLQNETMDTISANDSSQINGTINVKAINILSDAKEKETEILFTNSEVLKDKITSTTTASSKLYKYNVVYNDGYFNFTNTGGDIPKPEINPIIFESAIAGMASGLITQVTILNQAFSSIDSIRNRMTSAKEKGFLYASTADVVFNNGGIESGLWIRPFMAQDTISIDNLDVDNTLMGTLAGLDLAVGETSLVSFYLGYAGSNQKYEDIKVNQTGYIVGATGMIIKEKWYAGLTANINFNKAESESNYGTDSFDLNIYSVGAKAGYNYDINDKWTLEPNLTVMYGSISNQEYETTQGAKIDSQSNSNIIVEPQVKAKLDLTNGWQPYALLGYVANISDKAKVVVDGTEFETDKINGYVEYGAGINKDFINTPWSCYLEATGRSGGRNGFAGNLGIKYKF